MRSLAKLGLAAAVCWLAGGAQGQATELLPHRAIYDMSLAKRGGEIADVSGLMTYEMSDSCDGWAVTQRSLMSFSYQTGEEAQIGFNMVSWESKDGLRYRFFMRHYENGQVSEEVRGEAHLDGTGKGGLAEYTLPKKQTVKLPPGTLFPTTHTERLVERAAAGDPLLWATLFDGTDADGLFDVSAAMTKRRAGEPKSGRWPLLAGIPSWPIGLAFYASTTQNATPEHEQNLRLHSNGVIDAITFDYGDFSVAGKLTKLEKLPPPPC